MVSAYLQWSSGSINACSFGFTEDPAWRDETAWAGRRVNSAWKVPTTSHLQKETQRPRPRDCQVLFAEHPSQTFYEIGITPKPEKSLGSAYILKRMSKKSLYSPRDCLPSEEPACSLLLAARALPDGRIPSCHKQKEQEARPLHLSCSWCCHRALQKGAQKYAKFSPNFSSCYVAQSAILPV